MGPSGSYQYQLWLADHDEQGKPIDQAILQAAYNIGSRFFAYRRSDLQCESTANTLVQQVVESASRAAQTRGEPIPDLTGYLLLSYKYRLNKYLARQGRMKLCPCYELDSMAADRNEADRLADSIYGRAVLAAMDPATRNIFIATRLRGYGMTELAAQMGLTVQSLCKRYRRGIDRVMFLHPRLFRGRNN
jgi:DNA-directed RNA polymerase specialized sigma24 family protein